MALEYSQEMRPNRNNHSSLKIPYGPSNDAPAFPEVRPHNTNLATLKNNPFAGVHGAQVSLKDQLASAETGPEKVKVVLNALSRAKGSEASKVMAEALRNTEGADRAQIMVALVKQNPAVSTHLATMDPALTSLQGADLRSVGQDLALLPLNKINVQHATFINNLDLSKNSLDGANFDGVTAPGLVIGGAYGQFSAQGARMKENVADNPAVAGSAVKLSLAGADTGNRVVQGWELKTNARGTTLDPSVAHADTPKLTTDGAQIQAQKKPALNWALLPSSPAPPA